MPVRIDRDTAPTRFTGAVWRWRVVINDGDTVRSIACDSRETARAVAKDARAYLAETGRD